MSKITIYKYDSFFGEDEFIDRVFGNIGEAENYVYNYAEQKHEVILDAITFLNCGSIYYKFFTNPISLDTAQKALKVSLNDFSDRLE